MTLLILCFDLWYFELLLPDPHPGQSASILPSLLMLSVSQKANFYWAFGAIRTRALVLRCNCEAKLRSLFLNNFGKPPQPLVARIFSFHAIERPDPGPHALLLSALVQRCESQTGEKREPPARRSGEKHSFD